MSDPVTNAAVEDVLSSVRRLVSEDKRPPLAKDRAKSAGRLVLTPALRVSAPVEPIEDAENLVDVHAAQELVSHVPDDEGDIESADFQDAFAENDIAENDIASQAEDQPHADHTVEATLAPLSKADALRAKIAELEAEIGSITSGWAETSDQGGNSASDISDEWEDATPEDAMPPAVGEAAPEEHIEDEEQDESALEDMDVMGLPDAPDYSEEAQIEASVADIYANETAEHDTASDFALSEDTQLIDEDALRDLVSEIVRSELQGDLGERITRNVRKLVRREIQRALTAHELD